MNTSRVNVNQMLTLLVLFLSSSAALVSVGRFSGQNIWIANLISGGLGVILYTIYYRISKINGFKGLPDILRSTFGKWIGGMIIIAYAGYFLYLTTGLLKSMADMVQATLMIDVNTVLVAALLMIPVIYGLSLGFNTVGRSSELLFYVVCLCFLPLVISIITSDIFKIDNLFPILEDGFSSLYKDIYTTLVFPFGEAITFLFIFPLIPEDKKGRILKYSYAAITIATLILTGIDVINIGILGPTLTKNFIYPFFNSMKMVGVSVLFERVDPLAIIILMTGCFFKVSIYFYAGLRCIESMIGRFSYRQLALPLGLILVFLTAYLGNNHVADIYRTIVVNPKLLLPMFELAIPALFWIISEIKYKKRLNELKN